MPCAATAKLEGKQHVLSMSKLISTDGSLGASLRLCPWYASRHGVMAFICGMAGSSSLTEVAALAVAMSLLLLLEVLILLSFLCRDPRARCFAMTLPSIGRDSLESLVLLSSSLSLVLVYNISMAASTDVVGGLCPRFIRPSKICSKSQLGMLPRRITVCLQITSGRGVAMASSSATP